MRPLRRGKATATAPAYQTYATTACHGCPLKTQCTSGKNGRQLKRYEGDELKEALRLVMEHPKAKKRLKQRKAMVEPVFSHIKLRQNLNRFKRKGILGVKLEFSLQMMAYNISRAIAKANNGSLMSRLCDKFNHFLSLFSLLCPLHRRENPVKKVQMKNYHPRVIISTASNGRGSDALFKLRF